MASTTYNRKRGVPLTLKDSPGQNQYTLGGTLQLNRSDSLSTYSEVFMGESFDFFPKHWQLTGIHKRPRISRAGFVVWGTTKKTMVYAFHQKSCFYSVCTHQLNSYHLQETSLYLHTTVRSLPTYHLQDIFFFTQHNSSLSTTCKTMFYVHTTVHSLLPARQFYVHTTVHSLPPARQFYIHTTVHSLPPARQCFVHTTQQFTLYHLQDNCMFTQVHSLPPARHCISSYNSSLPTTCEKQPHMFTKQFTPDHLQNTSVWVHTTVHSLPPVKYIWSCWGFLILSFNKNSKYWYSVCSS